MLTQGDQYSIYDKITENGTPIDINKIKKIEFTLGHIKKYYPVEATFDYVKGAFKIPLTQKETFSLAERFEYQVAIQFLNGDVFHTLIKTVSIQNAVSKEVFENA